MLVKLIAKVKSMHSYKTPEVISMDISGGNADYIEWVLSGTAQDHSDVVPNAAVTVVVQPPPAFEL